jgi:antitoxin VapB
MNARIPTEALSSTQKYTTVFTSGNSQAVRLPKEFRFNSKQVIIERRGDTIVLREKQRSLGQSLREVMADLPPLSEKDAADLDAAMADLDGLLPVEERLMWSDPNFWAEGETTKPAIGKPIKAAKTRKAKPAAKT